MMDITLAAVRRDRVGKGGARSSRRQGRIPAICYGLKKEPLPIAVDPKATANVIRSPGGRNAIVRLAVEGESEPRLALLKAHQVHPLKRTLLHVDFLEVEAGKPLVVRVPVRLTGRPEGVKLGGKLFHVTRDVDVRCTPERIPAELVVDVTPLGPGQRLTVDELPMPEGVEPVMRVNLPVAVIKSAREEAETKGPAGTEGETAPTA